KGGGRRSVVAQAFRHPLQTTRLLNSSNVKLFLDLAHHSGFRAALSTTSRVMNNYNNDVRRVESIQAYTRHLDDVPEHLVLPYFEEPLVTIVIPVYNQYRFTMACLESIIRNTLDISYEVILGDDRSSDETISIGEHVDNLVVVRNETNLGFTLNCNHAAEMARGRYIHFLNNDTLVCEEWLKPLVKLMESSEKVGIVGSKLVYPDGILQEAGGIIWSDGTALNYGKGDKPNAPQFNYVKEVDYITGASMMVRRSLFEELGHFDAIYAPAYCEDSDLALAARERGYSVLYQPLSVVIHFEGMTHGKAVATRINPHQQVNVGKLRDKWSDYMSRECNPPGIDVFHARDRSMNRKTILFVTNHLPARDLDSGNTVIYRYQEVLVSMGYNVKLASADHNYDPTYAIPLQQMGVEIFFGTPGMENWKDLARRFRKEFDHIVLCGYACASRFGRHLDRHMKARIHYLCVGDMQVAMEREYDLSHDSHVLMGLALYKRTSRSVLGHVESVIVVSRHDADAMRASVGGSRLSVLPYAVPDAAVSAGVKAHDILFVGFLGSRCNADAVRWFVTEVLPRVLECVPDAVFRVVGGMAPDDLADLQGEHMVLEGHLEDVRIEELYSGCSVFVDPVRFSAGLRGNLLDAMARGIPVVGSVPSLECMGDLDLTPHDDAVGFADEVVRILTDAPHAEHVGDVGRGWISDNCLENEIREGFRSLFG
ncbi:MAG: glycosyltransferase, partial [archaeon]|nr:glycosyltransferase [archaeon]